MQCPKCSGTFVHVQTPLGVIDFLISVQSTFGERTSKTLAAQVSHDLENIQGYN